MSEIRERAKEYLDFPFSCDGVSVVTDLLAELERADAENECLKAWKAGAEIAQDDDEQEIRKQAARECIEIIDKYPAFLFGADAVGVKLNLSQSIKAHFAIKG